MTRSMTAFARQETHQSAGSLVWEIRSVNHRYLEPTFRLPELFRDLEGELRERLRTELSRGKVECTLRFSASHAADSLELDSVKAQEVMNALRQLQQLAQSEAPLDLMEVLKWPGVTREAQPDMAELKAAALSLFEQALNDLQAGRVREGQELAKLVQQRLDSINTIVSEVRSIMPKILQAQHDQLCHRIAEVCADADPARLEQELVLLAQRADVDEEMDRLETHVLEVKRVLKQKGPIGRRLDFLMQELNREANTLSSKSIVASTTQSAVELKVLIEQMREQIQNIE